MPHHRNPPRGIIIMSTLMVHRRLLLIPLSCLTNLVLCTQKVVGRGKMLITQLLSIPPRPPRPPLQMRMVMWSISVCTNHKATLQPFHNNNNNNSACNHNKENHTMRSRRRIRPCQMNTPTITSHHSNICPSSYHKLSNPPPSPPQRHQPPCAC